MTPRVPSFAIVLSLGCACSGRAQFTSVDGHHAVSLTCVPTEAESGANNIMYAGTWENSYTLADSHPGGVTVTDNAAGCSFSAKLVDGVVSADGAKCPVASASPLGGVGAASLEERAFSLSIRTKTFADFTFYTKTFSAKGNSQPDQFYEVCEGEVDGGSLPTGTSRLAYSAPDFHWTYGNDPGQACLAMVGSGQSKGLLYVHYGADKSELVVYETGVGCTVHARSDENGVYRADDTDCELNASGVSRLGVTKRHFDTFALDPAKKTWTFTSHLLRTLPDGTVHQQCGEMNAQLDGELPASG